MSPLPDPYFLLPLADGEPSHCSNSLLCPSVLWVLYCTWTDTWTAVTAWLTEEDLGWASQVVSEEMLLAWVKENPTLPH